jgi:hypothetical protein
MHLAPEALLARQTGDVVPAADLAREALPLEIEAAARITNEIASEPSRSSAMSMTGG